MMDYMSSLPPPDTKHATAYIVNEMKLEYKKVGISETDLRIVVEEELSKFHGLGSLAAWYSITASMVMKNVRDSMNKKFTINLSSQ
jgi:hypothetical protein